jgi:hypothetical protein
VGTLGFDDAGIERVDADFAGAEFFREEAGDRGECAEFVDASVVHEDIDSVVGGFGLGDEADNVGGFGDVALDREGITSGRGDFGDDFIGTGFAGGVVDDDGGAGSGEVLGGAPRTGSG